MLHLANPLLHEEEGETGRHEGGSEGGEDGEYDEGEGNFGSLKHGSLGISIEADQTFLNLRITNNLIEPFPISQNHPLIKFYLS